MPEDTKKTTRKSTGSTNANKNISGNINGLVDQLFSISYGSTPSRELDVLNTRFDNFIQDETHGYSKQDDEVQADDPKASHSFLDRLFNNNSTDASDREVAEQLSNIFNTDNQQNGFMSFLNEAYKNRMLKLADLHEVSTQLIELREAILITRDAIISSDIVERKMSRVLKFRNEITGNEARLNPIVEAMEEKFGLQDKIKNFILVNTLTYGEYYAYVIPYSKIFSDFMKMKQKKRGSGRFTEAFNKHKELFSKNKTPYEEVYTEKTLKEIVYESEVGYSQVYDKDLNVLFEESFNPMTSVEDMNDKKEVERVKSTNEGIFTEYLDNIMENITICNDPVPLAFIEDGVDAIDFFSEKFIDEDTYNEKSDITISNIGKDSFFNKVMKDKAKEGLYSVPGLKSSKSPNSTSNSSTNFKNVEDCFLKMIDTNKIVPIKIMDKVLGYYYITSDDVNLINGNITNPISNSSSVDTFDTRTNTSLVDAVAKKIVRSFNKDFLRQNIKFKNIIAEALSFYNLNENKVRFQFIPAEFIVPFKINEDEYGYGTSMIEGSLFYAKLYLMHLLFKMMSIILYSNDSRVNYVRSSGIDKNIRKKIEEIARIKQQRQINIIDLFSYTNLINKIGIGNETYIPVGKGNERAIETEILQGQDIQLNNDFMENLKKNAIMGTGVPDAILNYINEADFAKQVELANTRYLGRVVSYQIDFNKSITDLYKRMMRWCTSIDEADIDSFEFTFSPPKNGTNQVKADMLGNFETYSQWALGLYISQDEQNNPDNLPVIMKFKKSLASDFLPMINIDKLDEMFKDAQVEGTEQAVKPKGKEDDSGDMDMGF